MENATIHAYLEEVKQTLLENGDPERAQGQMWYMRHQYEFFGLKANEWMAIAKDFFNRKGFFHGEELMEFARLCYEAPQRELQYFALEMVQKAQKTEPEDFIGFFEELITTKPWWDTVDWIAKLVGIHFRRFPHLTKPVTEGWMASGNIWLQRVSMIFQLSYKEKTDEALLFDYILRLRYSKEFFIQKGAGWALRQYSKTNGNAVQSFIESNNDLPPLTKREGLKWLKNSQLK
jgi:3-methyladenine DNA glycosylase AlkD